MANVLVKPSALPVEGRRARVCDRSDPDWPDRLTCSSQRWAFAATSSAMLANRLAGSPSLPRHRQRRSGMSPPSRSAAQQMPEMPLTAAARVGCARSGPAAGRTWRGPGDPV
jgi:hypothetical protein